MNRTNNKLPNRHLQLQLAIRKVTFRRASELAAELTMIALGASGSTLRLKVNDLGAFLEVIEVIGVNP